MPFPVMGGCSQFLDEMKQHCEVNVNAQDPDISATFMFRKISSRKELAKGSFNPEDGNYNVSLGMEKRCVKRLKRGFSELCRFLREMHFIRKVDANGEGMHHQLGSQRKGAMALAKKLDSRGRQGLLLFGHQKKGRPTSETAELFYANSDLNELEERKVSFMVHVYLIFEGGFGETLQSKLFALTPVHWDLEVRQNKTDHQEEYNAEFEIVLGADDIISGMQNWNELGKSTLAPEYMEYLNGFPVGNNDPRNGIVMTQPSPDQKEKDSKAMDCDEASKESMYPQPVKRNVKMMENVENPVENAKKEKKKYSSCLDCSHGISNDDMIEMFENM